MNRKEYIETDYRLRREIADLEIEIERKRKQLAENWSCRKTDSQRRLRSAVMLGGDAFISAVAPDHADGCPGGWSFYANGEKVPRCTRCALIDIRDGGSIPVGVTVQKFIFEEDNGP